ncbi:MAG: Methylase involved in ubiquinone/menaquinone biosynthesis [Candidatus Curtissbacteria bacterium GW2011_GWA1_40_47]|uniref:Methyltransferase type 11 domain-containing protein n=1 Tax=Candidatus Curtissbacteria bacterium RIFOXYA1_FULL_41_14 TaxID=1797737 RepID=A0A1F5HB70_9BACT|nr:MAG: Methylase involved in ubiquinone/menaquinone biosynthesis [Candidatus Curtissbacteria bacterium GW2011_GWB1_40_28]KKR62299.1 MAG: Methylase involved in ubiquinone/menaquinone biosynthesis [Microgenomates group bacterium GW2011_GWC1_40_35]KKR66301.1 MAG: Methylase involved in ubiquinone/menaquinone biosynthesis [Candidatus Curtissbacteria bacterium GW2011_GWA1_40_47]KKR76460.1 MAG: Methylase involved in ubiquinone/menaquinone biosynthesis [Candidatus Curtissbacteria bacterium GW2011_GWD1_
MEYTTARLYRLRFEKDIKIRNEIWKVLCQDFFQKYIKTTDTICDLGAGFCEFINNIKAQNKIAIDVNPESRKYAASDVQVVACKSVNLAQKIKDKLDVVFASNFFEHLPTKEELVITVDEIRKVLKKRGRLIILMPNIRYVGSAYWDFLDHQLPLSDKSMIELLELKGFRIIEKKSKFLPYSTKGNLPKIPILVRFYLKLTPLHLIFGKQSLIVAQKD